MWLTPDLIACMMSPAEFKEYFFRLRDEIVAMENRDVVTGILIAVVSHPVLYDLIADEDIELIDWVSQHGLRNKVLYCLAANPAVTPALFNLYIEAVPAFSAFFNGFSSIEFDLLLTKAASEFQRLLYQGASVELDEQAAEVKRLLSEACDMRREVARKLLLGYGDDQVDPIGEDTLSHVVCAKLHTLRQLEGAINDYVDACVEAACLKGEIPAAPLQLQRFFLPVDADTVLMLRRGAVSLPFAEARCAPTSGGEPVRSVLY